jgi:hypothetical protein
MSAGLLAGYDPDMDAVRRDVEALARMSRSSARAGERESASWLRRRLAEIGVMDVELEGYRYQPSYALAHGAHNAAGIGVCRIGGLTGGLLAAATLWSYEREVSGRSQWVRKLLPGSEGANVVGRVRARAEPSATIVLVAHHDAANTGAIWNPRLVAAGGARHLRRRRVDPFMAPLELALVLAAAGSALGRRSTRGRRARVLAAAILTVASAIDADVGRGRTVPGASDNASGAAACLDLARAVCAEPLEHTNVVFVFPGSEEAGMGGMAAFLDRHGAELSADTFVLGLDTLGAGTPIVCTGEGAMREQRYAERDVALVEHGAAIAGEPAPQRWRIGAWTDPILAAHRGLRSASVLSIGPGYFPHYHHPSDLPDCVDWESVAACARIAAGTIAAFAGSVCRGTPG